MATQSQKENNPHIFEICLYHILYMPATKWSVPSEGRSNLIAAMTMALYMPYKIHFIEFLLKLGMLTLVTAQLCNVLIPAYPQYKLEKFIPSWLLGAYGVFTAFFQGTITKCIFLCKICHLLWLSPQACICPENSQGGKSHLQASKATRQNVTTLQNQFKNSFFS